jgi:transposase-like protein
MIIPSIAPMIAAAEFSKRTCEICEARYPEKDMIKLKQNKYVCKDCEKKYE